MKYKMNTISIEAFNIHMGGAKILLIYLIEHIISQTNFAIELYIRDSKLTELIEALNSDRIKVRKVSTCRVLFNFLRKRCHIIYFGNLPPMVRSPHSLLYIHNMYLTLSPEDIFNENISLKSKIRVYLQGRYLKLFHKNVDTIACQTKMIMVLLQENYGIGAKIMPFFEDIHALKPIKHVYDVCYIGLPSAHKNHDRFLRVIKKVIECGYEFRVAVTIPNIQENANLFRIIKEINKDKEFLTNYNSPSRTETLGIYSQSKALFFPSLRETLGLPLIEALQSNLIVISSDLPFTHEIVENPIIFDPLSEEDMHNQIVNFLGGKFDNIKQTLKISNAVARIIEEVH